MPRRAHWHPEENEFGSTRAAFLLTVTLGFALIPFTPRGREATPAMPTITATMTGRASWLHQGTSGKIVPDAKVTAEIKGLGSVVTRSDKLGTYKLPGFGKHISPNNITISCSKDGYTQTRTLRARHRKGPGHGDRDRMHHAARWPRNSCALAAGLRNADIRLCR